jgi:cell division protein FtsB
VAELADALRSGRSGHKPMWVQIPPSALIWLDFLALNGATTVANEKKKRSGVPLIQFVALILATIALSLLVDFGRKVALYRRLRLEEARLDQAIEYEEKRREYLEWLKGYVQTDQFVEEWARREGKMVKPDETLVVPLMQ